MSQSRRAAATPFGGAFASAPLLAGGAALAVGVVVLLAATASAVSVTPTPDAPAPQIVLPVAQGDQASGPLPRIADIVDQNVFSPDRRAPLVPYRLAGNEVETFAAMAEEAEVAVPVVLGTAVGEGKSSFAMCSLAGAPTVVVRVGDQLGDYTVRSIARGVVEFSSASGERVSVNANPS
jgi:hypothetical protein